MDGKTQDAQPGSRGSLGVAVLIMAVLATACFVLPWCPVRPRRRYSGRCGSNLKQLGLALQLYTNDHVDRFPPRLADLYRPGYAGDSYLFICPSGGQHLTPMAVAQRDRPGYDTTRHVSYCYVTGYMATDPGQFIIAFDVETNHDGRGVYVVSIAGGLKWMTDIDKVRAKLKEQAKHMREKRGVELIVRRPSWSSHAGRGGPESRPSRHAPEPARKTSVGSGAPAVLASALAVLAASATCLVVFVGARGGRRRRERRDGGGHAPVPHTT